MTDNEINNYASKLQQLLQQLLDQFPGAITSYSLRDLSKTKAPTAKPGDYSDVAALYSLRDAKSGFSGPVVRIRRSSDNAEKDFTAAEVKDGTAEAWVTGYSDTLPLDTANAAAAYSLRNLSSSYTGPVVRVRRSSDNTEADFTAEEITDGTLEAFVGAGNNGYVVTWYDQSGNGNDVIQATASYQNKIVSSGSTITDGGKPSILINHSRGLLIPIAASSRQDFFQVHKTNDDGLIVFKDSLSTLRYVYAAQDGSTSTNLHSNYGTPSLYVNSSTESPVTRDDLHTLLSTNSQVLMTSLDGDSSQFTGGIQWGYYSSAFIYDGNVQEIIFYNSDQSSNRTTIEGNINQYYDIYTTDGLVTTWYDQSGNNNHATQVVAANQPKLIDAGSLVLENGEPALLPDGVNDIMNVGTVGDIQSIFTVAKPATDINNNVLLDIDIYYAIEESRVVYRTNTYNPHNFPSDSNQQLVSTIAEGASDPRSVYSYRNGSPSIDNPLSLNLATGLSLQIFGAGGAGEYDSPVQEIVLYSSDKSADREKIEYEINAHYGIYTQWDGDSVVRVRRTIDNAEMDFTATEILDGTLTDWVNGYSDTLPLDTANAAAAYSLRNLSSSYTGPVVRVRRSSDNAESDFTGVEVADGTMLSWVNEEVVVYTSDFTSGNKDLGEVNGIGSDGEAVDGVSDAYKFTLSGGSSLHYARSPFATLTQGKTYRISYDYYIPSTNTAVDGVRFAEGTTLQNNTILDAWVSNSIEFISESASGFFTFLALDGASLSINADGDVFYLKNIVVTQTTADGHVVTWYDQSGNSNDATQSTAANQPKIVDAGVLVTDNGKAAVDFDGVDDLLSKSNFNITGTSAISSFSVGYGVVSGAEGIFGIQGSIGNADGYVQTFETGIRTGGGFATFGSQSAIESSLVSTFFPSAGDISDILCYINGASSSRIALGDNTINLGTPTDFYLGNGGVNAYEQKIVQEVILYSSDQSANRTTIEGNINQYYDIYTADGFLTTWYDQSGNINSATQTTAANQPKIVDAGSLITSNGYNVVQYDGTDDNLATSLTATGTMLMGGSDGSAFYEVDINGAYDLLADPNNTDHPLNETIRIIWNRTLSTSEKTAIGVIVNYIDWDFSDITSFSSYWRERSELTQFPLIDTSSGTNFQLAWYYCSSLTSFPLIDTSSATSFLRAWNGCSSLTSFPLIDTSSGTNFFNTWNGCSSLNSFPLIDTSSGTNFKEAWRQCSSLTTFPLIDTSSGVDFTSAWYGCTSLTTFPLIDTSSGTNFNQAWLNCTSLTSFPLIDTSSGVSFVGAWQYCSSLTTFPLIDTSSGTNFIQGWFGCSSLTSFPLIDTSSGTNFTNTWFGCSSLTNFPLINTSNGTNFNQAWRDCTSLTSFPLIDTSSGTNFIGTWQNCSSLTSFPLIDTSSGTDFQYAWYGCTSLTSFPLINTSSGTNFDWAWFNCTSLTSFPLIDTSSSTSFTAAWFACVSLTSFPLIDTSSSTSFANTWRSCISLTSFPLIDSSSVTSFESAWRNCRSLTSFPLINTSSGTYFSATWQDCTSLTTIPANMFDSCPATNFPNAFTNTNLTSQSIENIVVSIDTAGQSNGILDITGGGNATTATAQTAIDNLRAKGWTVTVPDGY